MIPLLLSNCYRFSIRFLLIGVLMLVATLADMAICVVAFPLSSSPFGTAGSVAMAARRFPPICIGVSLSSVLLGAQSLQLVKLQLSTVCVLLK